MSEALNWAVTAVRLVDQAEAERWFGAVCAAGEEVTDWGVYVQRLYDVGGQAGFDAEQVDWFTEGLAARTTSPLAVVTSLRADRSTLPGRYFALAEPFVDDETQEWAKYTPAQWYEYLTQTLGDGWLGWDGTEAGWAGFRDQFVLNAEHAGVCGPATEFLAAVQAAADKVTAFAGQGITITSAAPALPDAGRP